LCPTSIWKYSYLAVLITISCAHEKQTPGNVAVIDDIEMKARSIEAFEDVFHLERIVALETSDEALIGNIKGVMVDPDTGNLFVGDDSGEPGVFEMSPDGKLIRKHTRRGTGPGEINSLVRFTRLASGAIALLGPDKLVLLDKDWQLEGEITLDYTSIDMVSIGNRIYVMAVLIRRPEAPHAVLIYNDSLEEVGSFSDEDPRTRAYRYLPWKNMAARNGEIFLSHLYELRVSHYDRNGNQLGTFELPSENDALEEVWNKADFTEDDRRKIKTDLHRFLDIKATPEGLYLLETQRKTGTLNMVLYNHEARELTRLTGYNFMSRIRGDDRLELWMVEGNYAGGLIGSIQDTESFATFRDRFPELRDTELEMRDNPILVFFSINR